MVAMSHFQLYDGILLWTNNIWLCWSPVAFLLPTHRLTPVLADDMDTLAILYGYFTCGGDHTCGWKPCCLYSLSNFPDCPHHTKAVNLCVWPGPEPKPNVEPGSISEQWQHFAKRQRGTTRHGVDSCRKWSFLHKKMSGTSGNVWAGRVSLKLWGEQRKFPHVGAPRHVWKCFDPVAVCWVPPINRRDDVHP